VSGESIEYAQPLFLQGMDMQKFGAAITYARRYGWASALGIASDDDDDGTHASASPKKEIAQEFAQPTDAVISEPQRKRLFAKAKERGLSDKAVKDLIKRIAGVDSSAAISKYKYDAVIASIEEDIPF
jgi:hypothetical protein